MNTPNNYKPLMDRPVTWLFQPVWSDVTGRQGTLLSLSSDFQNPDLLGETARVLQKWRASMSSSKLTTLRPSSPESSTNLEKSKAYSNSLAPPAPPPLSRCRYWYSMLMFIEAIWVMYLLETYGPGVNLLRLWRLRSRDRLQILATSGARFVSLSFLLCPVKVPLESPICRKRRRFAVSDDNVF